MKDFEKMRKYLQRDFELMFILYIIFTILALLDGVTLTSLQIGVRLLIIILFGFGIYSAKKGLKWASFFWNNNKYFNDDK